jgi:hypothetical protein
MKSAGKIIGLCFILTLLFAVPLLAEEDDETPAIDEPLLSREPRFITDESALSEEFDDEDFDDESFFFNAPTLVFEVPEFDPRSFYDVFPNLSMRQRSSVMSSVGLRNAFEKKDTPTFSPNPDSGVDLYSKIMAKRPSHLIEALVLVSYGKRELDLIDIYNALRRIKNIQDYKLIVRDREYKIFQDTTRLESAQRRRPIADPPQTDTLPLSETMYLRFVDLSMGDLYLRGEVAVSLYGLTYTLTNFRDVTYSIFTVMKAERYLTIIYLEPVKEGILIYSMSGLYIPSFVSSRINLPLSMNYRITVLMNWITDSLRKEENNVKTQHFYQILK